MSKQKKLSIIKKTYPFHNVSNILTTLLSVPLDKSPKVFGGNNKKAVVEIYINDNVYKLQIHQKDVMTVKFQDSKYIYIQKELLFVNQQKQIVEQKLKNIRDKIVDIYLSSNDTMTIHNTKNPDDIKSLMKDGISPSELFKLLNERGIPEEVIRRKEPYVPGTYLPNDNIIFNTYIEPYRKYKQEFIKWDKKKIFLLQIQFPLQLKLKKVEGTNFLEEWVKEDHKKLVFLETIINKCKNRVNTLIYYLRTKEHCLPKELPEDLMVEEGPKTPEQETPDQETSESEEEESDSDEVDEDDEDDVDIEQWNCHMMLKKLLFLKIFLYGKYSLQKGALIRSTIDRTNIGIITNIIQKRYYVLWINDFLNDQSIDEEASSKIVSYDEIELVATLLHEKELILQQMSLKLHTFPEQLYTFFTEITDSDIELPFLEIKVNSKHTERVISSLEELVTKDKYIRLPTLKDDDSADIVMSETPDSDLEDSESPKEEHIDLLRQYIGFFMKNIPKGLMSDDIEKISIVLQ